VAYATQRRAGKWRMRRRCGGRLPDGGARARDGRVAALRRRPPSAPRISSRPIPARTGRDCVRRAAHPRVPRTRPSEWDRRSAASATGDDVVGIRREGGPRRDGRARRGSRSGSSSSTTSICKKKRDPRATTTDRRRARGNVIRRAPADPRCSCRWGIANPDHELTQEAGAPARRPRVRDVCWLAYEDHGLQAHPGDARVGASPSSSTRDCGRLPRSCPSKEDHGAQARGRCFRYVLSDSPRLERDHGLAPAARRPRSRAALATRAAPNPVGSVSPNADHATDRSRRGPAQGMAGPRAFGCRW